MQLNLIHTTLYFVDCLECESEPQTRARHLFYRLLYNDNAGVEDVQNQLKNALIFTLKY